MDRRCKPVPCRQVAEGGTRSRRAGARPEGSLCARTSGDFRGRRYRIIGSGWQAVTWRGASGDPTRTLCRPADRRYFDKGNMAVVGKNFAVLESGGVHISGFLAWLAWAAVRL